MNVLITGASKGIGRALVLEFCKKNADVIIALARSENELASLQTECKGMFGREIITCVQNLSDPDLPVLKQRIQAISQLDIIIHNAGFLLNKSFQDQTDADWLMTFEVNVFAVARLTRKLLPYLQKSGSAHIVNIGSMGGFQGSAKFPGLSSYSASKGALAILSECLATELAADGIRCNCLALGAVNTEMLTAAFPGYKAPVYPEGMARFISDFSINAPAFINGKIIPVALTQP
jgi:3-oxoacyl-[acyl-carrier protein] reductase